MNIIKSLFVRANKNLTDSTVDAVNNLIKSGKNINPNDILYQNALQEVNDSLKKGSIKRLEVPSGFCGYIDPATGEYRVIPDPDTTLLRGSTIPQQSNEVNLPSYNDNPMSYPVDKCLEHGLPGSVTYANCQSSSEDVEDEESGIDWNGMSPAATGEGGADEEPYWCYWSKHHEHLFGTDRRWYVCCKQGSEMVSSSMCKEIHGNPSTPNGESIIEPGEKHAGANSASIANACRRTPE